MFKRYRRNKKRRAKAPRRQFSRILTGRKSIDRCSFSCRVEAELLFITAIIIAQRKRFVNSFLKKFSLFEKSLQKRVCSVTVLPVFFVCFFREKYFCQAFLKAQKKEKHNVSFHACRDIIRLIFRRKQQVVQEIKHDADSHFIRDFNYTSKSAFCKYPFYTIFRLNFR